MFHAMHCFLESSFLTWIPRDYIPHKRHYTIYYKPAQSKWNTRGFMLIFDWIVICCYFRQRGPCHSVQDFPWPREECSHLLSAKWLPHIFLLTRYKDCNTIQTGSYCWFSFEEFHFFLWKHLGRCVYNLKEMNEWMNALSVKVICQYQSQKLQLKAVMYVSFLFTFNMISSYKCTAHHPE